MSEGIDHRSGSAVECDIPAGLKGETPLFVTKPTMPDINKFVHHLRRIWQSRWLTNQGHYHQELERRLCEYLGVEQLSLFCNGTIALLVALQALRINGGQVITTPFTFPATAHVLFWNRIEPVFCDIDSVTMNMDPQQLEGLITPETRAILPVHVFGQPCDVQGIRRVADRHGLHVIYDAAHAFGVEIDGKSIAAEADISMLSFHATKLFSTMEGGALVLNSNAVKARVDSLKNFGIADEETVIAPGINGKMTEASAAFGLLHLDLVEREIEMRSRISAHYDLRLSEIAGITRKFQFARVRDNHSYYPIRIKEAFFGRSRDEVHECLRSCNVIARKYFYPLASRYPCYSRLPSSSPSSLPVAESVVDEILCLPIYAELEPNDVDRICDIIAWSGRRA